MPRYVYFFGGGHADGSAAMKDVLGGKGAGLAEMTNLGVPVPPGFTLGAQLCIEYIKTRSHPALLFWEFQDEPILNKVSIEGSRKGYQLVHREDPDHPMLVVEWPGAMDRLQLWKGIGDIFATDLGMPTVWVPHSYASCSQHAPNEHMLMPVAREGLQVMAGIYWDLGEAGVPSRAVSPSSQI